MKVQIRPLQEQDAYTSFKWRNIPEIWIHTEFKADREITVEDELKWIKKVMADPECRRFAIIADNAYVGNIYLTGIKGSVGDYHIFIGDRNYWGKGVAKASSLELIEYARSMLHLKAIKLRVKPGNVSAYALYAKLGFKDCGKQGEFVAMKLDLAGDQE